MDTSKPVNFEGLGMCFYEIIEKRHPKKGEYYLSGAIVEAYRAPNYLSSDYYVVKPTHYAKLFQTHVRGKAII